MSKIKIAKVVVAFVLGHAVIFFVTWCAGQKVCDLIIEKIINKEES